MAKLLLFPLHVLVLAALLVAAATSFVLQPTLQWKNENAAAAAAATTRRLPLVASTTTSLHFWQHPTRLTAVLLKMAADGENEVKTQVEPSSSAEEEEEEEEQKVEEDPELVKLKDEIKTLELTLKTRRQQAQTMQDRADHYSKAGYARKVAEMENMRRDRSRLQSSNAADATAVCLAEFLPVLDRMTELQQQYATHPYGKSYNSLADTLRLAFTEMGVTEYTVTTGDIVDKSRMLVVDTEYSNNYSANTVLRPISMGMELQGYIVRYAECVASLGSESAAKAAAATEQEAAEQEDQTPAEAA